MNMNRVMIDPGIKFYFLGMIFGILGKAPLMADKSIEKIEVLSGGLTNNNFKVTADGVPYAVRVFGEGTSEYIDRKAEKTNAQMMSEIGVNAQIYYFDENTGSAVSEFIDEAKVFHADDFRDLENIRICARIMHQVHTSGRVFVNRFDPCEVADQYVEILGQKKYPLYEEWPVLKNKRDEIRRAMISNPQPLVPCHNDALAENFLLNKNGLFLIDWEYCGMNDPMYDVGDFATDNELSYAEEMACLESYFGSRPTFRQYGMLRLNRFMVDLFWAVWSLLQIANGKDYDLYWDYGMTRINRCGADMRHPDFDQYIAALSSSL